MLGFMFLKMGVQVGDFGQFLHIIVGHKTAQRNPDGQKNDSQLIHEIQR